MAEQAQAAEISKFAQVKWLVQALMQGSAANFYSSMHELVIPDQGDYQALDAKFWFNLGDWSVARTYAEAGIALADRLARAAQLGPGQEVLDAGFGFGEQDLFWAKRYDLKKIVGLNVTEKQVQFAQYRAGLAGLADRLDLRLGSATEASFPEASFDRVVALESAHHFDTRERFFAQAFRVLRPGGRIGLADIIPMAGSTGVKALQKWMTRRMTGSPAANFYPRDVYARKLAAVGFVDVTVESIRHDVFPGNFAYYREKMTGKRADAIVIGPIDQALIDDANAKWALADLGDYVIASGRKPS